MEIFISATLNLLKETNLTQLCVVTELTYYHIVNIYCYSMNVFANSCLYTKQTQSINIHVEVLKCGFINSG